MTVLFFALGVILLVLALAISIALHELGHLVPAKKFGVKVTHYMIGFGPTLFSRRRGETVYGVKLLPLGGFIAMPGMYPPAQALKHGRARRGRLFGRTMAEAREYSNRDIEPGEEHRTFYALSVPKRLVVMFGGPVMNLLLGIAIMAVVLMGIGVTQPSTTVKTVVECAVPASAAAERSAEERASCQPGDEESPAWAAGLKPGDRIVSVGGVPANSWDQLSATIRDRADETVPVVIERDGTRRTESITIVSTERPMLDENGAQLENPDGSLRTEQAGFLGVSPTDERVPMPPAEFPGQIAENLGQIFKALASLPQNLVGLAETTFGPGERDENGPVGMVGVGRIAGEVASTDQIDVLGKVQLGLSLIGSINLFLFAFNMVPLLPLDGGHIVVALYEGARRRINGLRGKGWTGPVDTARMLPLTYVVVACMLGMTALLVYADIVEPIRIFS